MKTTHLIITVLLLVIVGGAGFFGGIKYQQSKTSNAFGQRFAGQGRQGGPNAINGRQGFRPVNGEIISQDDKSITVKLADGSSKIVLVNDKTTVNKAADATKADLKTGEKVAVFGQENSDGSVTAQTVELNPILRNAPSNPQPPGQ